MKGGENEIQIDPVVINYKESFGIVEAYCWHTEDYDCIMINRQGYISAHCSL